MDDLKIEELARKYPDIFEKSGDFELSVGDGWYQIIDTLLYLISYKIESSRRLLAYSLGKDAEKIYKPIAELEADIEQALAALPTIDQVKQKYGGLRFYISGGSPEIASYIEFAEAISARTCEVCGAPGVRRNEGWITVLCDHHYQEREEKKLSRPSKGAGPDSDEE